MITVLLGVFTAIVLCVLGCSFSELVAWLRQRGQNELADGLMVLFILLMLVIAVIIGSFFSPGL